MFNAIKGWFKPKFPGEEWINEANAEAMCTPDISEIELKQQVFLFLPCELQSGNVKQELALEGGKPLGMAFTTGSYSLLRDRLSQRAVMLPDKKGYMIKGELWVFQSTFISELDKYKFNGVQSERKKIEILIPFTKAGVGSTCRKKIVQTYEGRPEYWDKVVDNGFMYPKVRLYRPNNPFLNSFQHYHPSENFK